MAPPGRFSSKNRAKRSAAGRAAEKA